MEPRFLSTILDKSPRGHANQEEAFETTEMGSVVDGEAAVSQ